MLKHAVTCGLLAAGCEVVDVGILPTPTIQIYVAATRARGGIAITASHNPPEYNALKLFNAEGLFFNHYERGGAARPLSSEAFTEASNEEIRRVSSEPADADALSHRPRAGARGRRHASARGSSASRWTRVNGAGSVVTPGFLHEGPRLRRCTRSRSIRRSRFRAWPSRGPTRSASLSALVRAVGAEIGFAQDPDGDRLAVVDETGRVLDNDDVLALAVDAALRRVPGDVVVNLTTSSVIDDVARAHGRRVYRTPVGEANVVEMMQAVDAVIGGEGSNGGIIFPAVHLCRDSYTGMAFLLDRMAETGKTISELRARCRSTPGSWARCLSSTAAWAC